MSNSIEEIIDNPDSEIQIESENNMAGNEE
jgi:hypothetical protein